MEIEAFATAEDYQDIYGVCDEPNRLDALLLRATGYLLSKIGKYEKGEDPVFDLNAQTVCCAMVHRIMSSPKGLEGISQFQQTAGSYTANISMLDQYMRPLPSELDLLGIGDGSIVTTARLM